MLYDFYVSCELGEGRGHQHEILTPSLLLHFLTPLQDHVYRYHRPVHASMSRMGTKGLDSMHDNKHMGRQYMRS